ncbi:MAG: signal peptidase II [Deltaproteobacteria bacterium]|nr:signal peptidase II [Deltaproteobacteria bacterium]MBM4316307.1 signal peptidase II [Deltaproteobacteria bacterium]
MKLFPRWKTLTVLIIVTLVVVLDQWTKMLILARFQWGQSITIVPAFFALTYVRNMGAAFGILHNAPAYFRDPFFILIPILALVIITAVLVKLKDNQKLTGVALSSVMGGALGNLIDRVRFGYVVDFLDFHWKEIYHWPAFNVADSAIVIGVSYLFIQSFFQKNSAPQSAK